MRKLRFALILILGLFLYTILLSGILRNIYLSRDGGHSKFGKISGILIFLAETPSIIKDFFSQDGYLVPNNKLADGFSYYGISNNLEGNPKLLAIYKDGKFSQKIDLLDIKSGHQYKQWAPDTQKLYELGYNEKNPRKPSKGSDLYFMHPFMTTDSSLILTSQLTSLIVKIDPQSNLVWYKNDRIYHHSLESDSTGKIYSCTQPFESGEYDFLPGEYKNYKNTLMDDHITILDSETGNEFFDKSVLEILVENGYADLLLYKGQIISDPVHLNDVQPALSSSKFWDKGDLLVSCRNISTVFLYRPSTNKILWLKHGPWYNQHDADFYDDRYVVVFGNDVIRDESEMNPPLSASSLSFNKLRPHNNVYLYDFVKDTVITPYKRFMENEKVRTVTSGRSEILPNGDLFVEETTNGRIIIGDSISKKLEYVKRLDENHISWLFWSRIIN